MDTEDLKFNQYKLYAEQKEQFTARSFLTNRFYMITVIILFALILLLGELPFAYGLRGASIFAVTGIMMSILWWMNMDSYNTLIKIKLSDVIDKMEKELPSHPFENEYSSIQELKKNKKVFLFSEMQKAYAVITFILFLLIVLNEVTKMFCCCY
ncbi:hypothetical protein IJI31_00625 [bacterium]|nr:hypothetical protein [bacterium]